MLLDDTYNATPITNNAMPYHDIPLGVDEQSKQYEEKERSNTIKVKR